MNRVTRNLVLVSGTALASLLTVFVMLLLEARNGSPLFGYAVAGYIPVGAIGAGLIAAAGLLATAFLLRARPAPVTAIALVLISAGTVYLVQSAQLTLSSAGRVTSSDPLAFAQYLAASATHSQLQFADPRTASHVESNPLNPNAAAAAAMPQGGAEGDASVQSIGGSVQGMVASQDMGAGMASGTQQRISQIGDGIHDIRSTVQDHGSQWLLMALQLVGFSLGSLGVYSLLRSRSYCEHCSLLLRSKGSQKRYFSKLDEINGSVEDLLAKARDKRLQLAVQSHGARGAVNKDKAAFASTIHVSLCTRCQTHRLEFRALQKAGGGWKNIPVMGYTTSSYEPIEVAG